MTEPSSQESTEPAEPTEEPESKSLDLSALQSFNFGTQWTDAGKKPRGDERGSFRRGAGKGRRPDRRSDGGLRKDRRPPKLSFTDRSTRGDGGKGQTGDRRFRNRGNRAGGDEHPRGDRFQDFRPYESAVFAVDFYPDDAGFSTIIKALRTNQITYELFHVAKIFLEKSDRYVASVTRKAANGEKPSRVYVSVPDGMPFETEEEAIQHAVANYSDVIFETEEVEVEPPTGKFPFVNRCGITKKLIGPPNYHRYEEFLNLHHKTQLANTTFEKFKSSIEQVREEEVVSEWLESMKKSTSYTTKATEGIEPQTFDSLNDAIGYLRTNQKEQLVKAVNYARVSGLVLDKFSNTEASRAVVGELVRQQRFPLETANAIRGRLRREKFSIYKRGSKGVTFICATRRNFRKKGQIMSDSLDRLIRFIEEHQNIKAKELPVQYQAWLKEEYPAVSNDEKRVSQDLRWLIADGYVSHFSDDSLFAQPVMDNEPKSVASPKKSDTSKNTIPSDPVLDVKADSEKRRTSASEQNHPAVGIETVANVEVVETTAVETEVVEQKAKVSQPFPNEPEGEVEAKEARDKKDSKPEISEEAPASDTTAEPSKAEPVEPIGEIIEDPTPPEKSPVLKKELVVTESEESGEVLDTKKAKTKA
tara:strand:- start:1001 stop:2935 length:1935 start_codon:yes stop_codon:yes gene_type:complete